MEKEIKQILKNQASILSIISQIKEVEINSMFSIAERIKETSDLLNLKGTNEDCCEMEEKKGCGKIINPYKNIKFPCGDIAGGKEYFCDECESKFVKRGRGE